MPFYMLRVCAGSTKCIYSIPVSYREKWIALYDTQFSYIYIMYIYILCIYIYTWGPRTIWEHPNSNCSDLEDNPNAGHCHELVPRLHFFVGTQWASWRMWNILSLAFQTDMNILCCTVSADFNNILRISLIQLYLVIQSYRYMMIHDYTIKFSIDSLGIYWLLCKEILLNGHCVARCPLLQAPQHGPPRTRATWRQQEHIHTG